jgi:AcrR family transcriptional regulator
MVNESARPYRKRRRAEAEARTRERITEAAVELHGSIGPARTTISEVARRAGVQRATVYRHFPDEGTLFEACTAHYWARHPAPDPSAWRSVGDHRERLRLGLTEIYAWYADAEPMLTATRPDVGRVPAMEQATAAFLGYIDAVRAVLMRGRRERGRARHRVAAATSHALDFTSWRSLVVERGLRQEEAVALMVGLIELAGSSRG